MPTVPQKIRTGLVELRTSSGSVYVRPSFWERIYLLWTFRNFRSLPRQVLNRQQQQLIDKLCREAIVSRHGPIARTSIIGAVENVSLMPDGRTQAAAPTSKLVEMGTTIADVTTSRAVGSERISIRSNRAAHHQIDVGRFRRQSGRVRYISAPKQGPAEQSEAKEASPSGESFAKRTRSRNRVRWALVAACGVALLGSLFYFREGRLAAPVTAAQVAIEAHKSASGSLPSAAATQSVKVQQSMSTGHRHPASVITFKPSAPTASSNQQEGRRRKAVMPPQSPIATMESTPRERLQVEEAPETGFAYPVVPNPTLTGKVSLKAVIGTDGTVTEVDVLSGQHALAGAAVRAVRHWRYRPHELKGHAVEAETNIVISFVGADAVSISFPAAR